MSAKQLAKYVVALEAQTAKYQKGLDDARRRLGQFEKRNQVSLKAVGKSFLAVGTAVAAAGAAITAFAKKGIDAADQSIKAARTVGLTASQYEALSFAAQQSGVSVSSLNTSIQSFVRRLGEATQGGGQAADALSRLGLNAQTLAGLPTDVAMGKVADALQGVEGTAQRAQLAYQIFGRQGIELTRMLEGGSAALEAFRAESERFGVTLTATQVKNVEDATDAQGRLSTANRGLSMQLGATLAPAFIVASNAAANFLARITESIPKIAAFASELFGIQREADRLTLKDVNAEIDIYMKRLQRANNLFAQTFDMPGTDYRRNRIIEAAQEDIDELSARLEALVMRRDQLMRDGDAQKAGGTGTGAGGNAGEEAARIRSQNEQAAQRFISSTRDAVQSLEIQLAEAQRLADTGFLGDNAERVLRVLKEQLSEARLEASGFNDVLAQAQGYFDRSITAAERLEQQISEVKMLADAGIFDQLGVDGEQVLARLQEQLDKISEGMTNIADNTEDAANQMSEFGAQAARSIQSAFANFLFDPFSGGLKGMLQGFSETLRRMAAEIVANKLLTSFLGRLAGSSNSFFSSIGESFTPRAMGGPVSAGGNYLVGERGPELFFPGVSGMIMPNHAIAGGAQIINNITVQAPEGRISRQSELQLRQSLASATNEGLRRAG
jgi:hypothetical protein